jgi:hypothetical protein
MNQHEIEYESHPLMQHLDKAARHTCYPCKLKLEATRFQPYIHSLLGLLVLAHVWLSGFLVYLKAQADFGSYEIALIPVLILPVELSIACVLVIVVIYKDFIRLKVRGITVWQRQALGRLLRNILVFSLCSIGVFMIIQGLSQMDSLQTVLSPFLLLGFLGMAKFVMIETEDTWFWFSLTAFVEAGMLVGIYMIDYGGIVKIQEILCLAMIATMILLIFCMELTRRFVVKWEVYNAVMSLCGFFASILVLLCEILLFINAKFLILHSQLLFTLSLLACILYTISLSRPLGILIKDILTGHIQEPILQDLTGSRFLLERPHSV